MNNRQDAEETTSDVFYHLWRKIEKWEPTKGDLQEYLNTVARNLIIDRYRCQMRAQKRLPISYLGDIHGDDMDLFDTVPDPCLDPLEDIIGLETRTLLTAAITDALMKVSRPQHCVAWMLRYYYKHSILEVSRILGVKEGIVKIWSHRCKVEMRCFLRKAYEYSES